jgi:choline dehydrogenase-like flavoprotein
MISKTGADVVIAGTGIVGCLIAEQMLDAGLSGLMLEAGPRIDRGRIIENYRNMPPAAKVANPDGPFPPKPWALHPMDYTGDPDKDYLITSIDGRPSTNNEVQVHCEARTDREQCRSSAKGDLREQRRQDEPRRTVDLGHSSDGPSWIDLAEIRVSRTESRFVAYLN